MSGEEDPLAAQHVGGGRVRGDGDGSGRRPTAREAGAAVMIVRQPRQ